MKILVMHGPNLNMLGVREPERYGKTTLPEIDARLVALGEELGVTVSTFQSNHEGALVDQLQQQYRVLNGILVNPGGLTHTSVVLRDALLGTGLPFVEVHLTNVHAREPFRKHSYLSDVAAGVITGFGVDSYVLGLHGLVARLRR